MLSRDTLDITPPPALRQERSLSTRFFFASCFARHFFDAAMPHTPRAMTYAAPLIGLRHTFADASLSCRMPPGQKCSHAIVAA